jgi:acetyltransferase
MPTVRHHAARHLSVVRPVRAVLRDGSAIVIRPVRADDARYGQAFFAWLSDQTKYLRFMSPVKELTPKMLESALAQDGLRRVALVAEPARQDADLPTPAVAIGRYAPSPDPAECEVAVTVGDAWQNRGVGHALLGRLIVLACRGGYRTMVAVALATNDRMIALARSHGFVIDFEPGGVMTMRRALDAVKR